MDACRVAALAWGVAACSFTINEDELSGGAGTSGLMCSAQEKTCSVAGEPICAALGDPEYGCSSATCSPCIFANGEASCSQATGECFIGACIGSYADCDEREATGCETDLNRDVDNCRECARQCPSAPHANVACGSARCYILTCDPLGERGDCNTRYEDGCEIDFETDVAHCGECGNACPTGETCAAGLCR